MKNQLKKNRLETDISPQILGGSHCNPEHKCRTALITGATSGIGEVFANRYAAEGYNLILTGRNSDKLAFLSACFKKQYLIRVETVNAELSCERDLRNLLRILHSHQDIIVLVNNAGFGSGKKFGENQVDQHLMMIRVHVEAMIRLVHAVLPQMLDRHEGTIINVSSLAAFTPIPGSAVYSATKMFLLRFSESLSLELEKQGINVKCICPGFTRTGFHDRLQIKPNPHKSPQFVWMDAEQMVDKCLSALPKHNTVYVPGLFNRMMVSMISMLPRRVYLQLLRKLSD